jgi:16S rRNA (cytosine1402-N4)-methyltransferase
MDAHVPVMLSVVLDTLNLCLEDCGDALFVDATLGGGGHSEAVLGKFPNVRVIGVDRDEIARELAGKRLSGYGGRVRVTPGNFSEIEEIVGEFEGSDESGSAMGVLFDLGVSNMQLSSPERGFSYQEDGPLDMRMNLGDEITAADIVRESEIPELARIFREYGEERYAFRIAGAIVRSRNEGILPETTGQLTSLIRSSLPAPVQRKMGGHPARRVFQALRISVNGELEAVTAGLRGAYEITRDGGVIVVISYHSLEDRIVKHTFQGWAKDGLGSMKTRRPEIPSEDEIQANRKSRSAKLRAFIVKKTASDAGGTV